MLGDIGADGASDSGSASQPQQSSVTTGAITIVSQQLGTGSQQTGVVVTTSQHSLLADRFFIKQRRPRPAQAGLKVSKTVSVATNVQRVQ